MERFHAECFALPPNDSTRGLRSAGASDAGLSEKCKVGSRLFCTISPSSCEMLEPQRNHFHNRIWILVWKALARLARREGNLLSQLLVRTHFRPATGHSNRLLDAHGVSCSAASLVCCFVSVFFLINLQLLTTCMCKLGQLYSIAIRY